MRVREAGMMPGFARRFPAARWPFFLTATSSLATVLIVGVGYAAARVVPRQGAPHIVGIAVACAPVAVLAGALAFIVRAYEVDQRELRIERLLWWTTFPMEGLQRIGRDPAAMKGSIRIFGDGGLYEIAGLFRNRKLGNYRAFATDPRCSVVLFFSSRVIVVTPGDPEGFVEYLRTLFPTVPAGLTDGDRTPDGVRP
jgi:Bacterial PH domain